MRGLFHGKSQSKMDDERGTLHFRTPPYHVISLYIWLCDCISPVHSKFIHVSLLIPLCSKPNAINRPMNQPWVGSCYIIPVIEVYPISSNFINLACVDSLSHGVCHIICSYMFIIFHHIILYHIISYHICLVVWNIWIIFPFSWEFPHPNWRSHNFQRGGSTTNHDIPKIPVSTVGLLVTSLAALGALVEQLT